MENSLKEQIIKKNASTEVLERCRMKVYAFHIVVK